MLRNVEQVQDRCKALDDDRDLEIARLVQDYERRKAPHYLSRQQKIAPIRQFWRTALLAHPFLRNFVGHSDRVALQWLTAIELKPRTAAAATVAANPTDDGAAAAVASLTSRSDNSGDNNDAGALADPADSEMSFELELRFEPNPFFKEAALWVAVDYARHDDARRLSASGITWRDTPEARELACTIERRHDYCSDDDEGDDDEGGGPPPAFFWLFASDGAVEQDEDDDRVTLIKLVRDEVWPDPFSWYMMAADDDEDEDVDEVGEEADDDGVDDEGPDG